MSVEAHKDRNLRLLKSNESRELVNWIDGNGDDNVAADDNADDDDSDTNDDDNDGDNDTINSKFGTVDTDARQRE